VCADIEDLSLGKAFDAAILASNLINVPNESVRATQLRKCFEHLLPTGRILFERYDPTWLSGVEVGPLGNIGAIEMRVDEVRRSGAAVEMCCRYQEKDEVWLHRFSAHVLDDEAVQKCLTNAGFSSPEWINRTWGTAKVKK
jgi:hypothetical protein